MDDAPIARTVFITGGSSGIGAATVAAFRARGWNVASTSRYADDNVTGGVFSVRMDPGDETSIRPAVQAAIDRFGKIDVLVNNAGYGLLGPIDGMEPGAIADQFAVNVVGVMNTTAAVIPAMRDRGQGRIITVSSMLGRIGLPFFSPYSATKWAVEGFHESLAFELAPFGIDTVLIEPGTIKTEFFRGPLSVSTSSHDHSRQRFEKVLAGTARRAETGAPPEKVAQVIVKQAEATRPRLRVTTDRTGRALIALHRLLPPTAWRRAISRAVG